MIINFMLALELHLFYTILRIFKVQLFLTPILVLLFISLLLRLFRELIILHLTKNLHLILIFIINHGKQRMPSCHLDMTLDFMLVINIIYVLHFLVALLIILLLLVLVWLLLLLLSKHL